LTFGLLLGILALSLAGGFLLQPRLKALHRIKYSQQSTPEERNEAVGLFRSWHKASQIINLVMLAGLGAFAWRVSMVPNGSRFSAGKFRS